MELKVGMTFTGSEQCFTGRVEILEIDEPNNRLRVGLTKKNDTFNSNWNEDWNLQHTILGFERGDYFIKNFTDYPQDLQRSPEQQLNIPVVSPRLFFVVAETSEGNWEQITNGCESYISAKFYRDGNFCKKQYPNAFIVASLNEG